MRKIEPILTKEISKRVKESPVDQAEPFPVKTYRELVEQIARLSYLNKDYLLFFRGQGRDHRNKSGASTYYPAIYRGEYLPRREMHYRFDILEEASRQLRELFAQEKIHGYAEVVRKRYIQWSILQHYEVSATPLLDLTQSLRVACSFAQMHSSAAEVIVAVFGLPYVANRISINSEHDIVNIRLLSICPPDALRPYFQEGYLAGTEDITTEYRNKLELDFNRRLVAKFRIPNARRFWSRGFAAMPEDALYPKGDRVGELCASISGSLRQVLLPGQLGEFIQAWAELEEEVLHKAERFSPRRQLSIAEAIRLLGDKFSWNEKTQYAFHELRKFRNLVLHEPKKVTPDELRKRIEDCRSLKKQLTQKKR